MGRGPAVVIFAVFLIASLWSAPQLAAQQDQSADQESAEFASIYQRWQQAQDPEERIALGEQVIALEPTLKSWPLEAPRERIKSEIWFGLGSAYLERRGGVRADNVENAIAHLESALTVRSREFDPQDWAMAHNNIGIAYWSRIRGERADNQESAIAHFETAMTVFSREASADMWAQIQNNLAVAFWNRVRGERASNLETAIAYFEAALTVFARETHPFLWAQAQNNLGTAYRARIRGDRGDNREKAITHLELALKVFTRQTFSEQWATGENNLAITYSDRIRGDRASNQETAIAHFQAALTVFTRTTFPQHWAEAQHNLGITYAGRIRGKQAGNRKKAMAAFEAALSVFTRETAPREHMRTSRLLARELLKVGDWRKARPIHASAREAFLLLFGEGLEEAEVHTLISEAGPLFADAAFAALQRGENEAALELASEGRARLMAVALKQLTVDLPEAKRQRLDDLRVAIRTQQQVIEMAHGAARAAALEKLVALREELLGLLKSGQSKPGSLLAKAIDIVVAGNAIALPVFTEFGAKILLLTKATHSKKIAVVDLPKGTTKRLNVLLSGPGTNRNLKGWFGAYFINYLQGSEQDKRWPEWLAAVDKLGPDLWRLLGAKLDAALKERGVRRGARLVWLPAGGLGVLPLGLAQEPVSKRRLADDYEIVYAPSLEVLVASFDHASKAAPATLAAIINPTGDLAGTEKEGAIVASHFAAGARTLLERDAATPEAVLAALKDKSHWHFASHGTFSWLDPRQSALLMHDQARLSVGRLLETEGLGRPRLVVLSACETGLYDFIGGSPDEFIGLPGAFAALGAAGVLGTLWPVSDAATALLIAKFYELHMAAGLSPPTALSRAQAWLRQATNDVLHSYAKGLAGQGRLQSRHLVEIEHELGAEGSTRSRNLAAVGMKSNARARLARPYAHPYFWAGFIHTGL
jgi:CHAT domain-containing protein/tetratricopeptide (TPR) repeat protein